MKSIIIRPVFFRGSVVMCFSDSPAKVRRRSVYRKEASPDAAKTVRCGGRSGWTKWYNCKAVVFSKDHLGGDFNYFFIFTPNLGVAWSNLTFYFLTCFFFNRQLPILCLSLYLQTPVFFLVGRTPESSRFLSKKNWWILAVSMKNPPGTGGAERLTARTARTAVLFKLLFVQKCELKVWFIFLKLKLAIYYRHL